MVLWLHIELDVIVVVKSHRVANTLYKFIFQMSKSKSGSRPIFKGFSSYGTDFLNSTGALDINVGGLVKILYFHFCVEKVGPHLDIIFE